MDRAYEVSWQPGTITVHASSEKEAINIRSSKSLRYQLPLLNEHFSYTFNSQHNQQSITASYAVNAGVGEQCL